MMRRVPALAAAVVLLAGCAGSPTEPDPSPSAASETGDAGTRTSGTTTAPATTPTTEPIPQAQAVRCPRVVVEPDPRLPDEVPEGATSVRLCAGGDERVTPPVDALTADVEAVVSAVNEQRLVPRPRCADLRLPTYQLAFGYPDGSRFVVAGRFTGCAELLVGSARRAEAMPPLRSFVRLLREQRSTATPPDRSVDPDALDCAQPREDATGPLGRPTELTVAVLCFGLPQRPDRARRVTIPRADLATLVASMRTQTQSSAGNLGCPFFQLNDHWIVGTTAWGDPVTMTRGCYGLTIEGDVEWAPRGEARQIVRDLREKAR